MIEVQKNDLTHKFNQENNDGKMALSVELPWAWKNLSETSPTSQLQRRHQCKLSYVSEDAILEMAKFCYWTLKNKCKNCRDYALAKLQQTKFDREPLERSETPGECLFIDRSLIKEKNFGKSKFWLLVIQ